MSPNKIGRVGEIVLSGSDKKDIPPVQAVIVGHDAFGAPEMVPLSALGSREAAVDYLGAVHGPRFFQMVQTLDALGADAN